MSTNEGRWRITTIDFDWVSIFESDRSGHEAQALSEVEGEAKGGKKGRE